MLAGNAGHMGRLMFEHKDRVAQQAGLAKPAPSVKGTAPPRQAPIVNPPATSAAPAIDLRDYSVPSYEAGGPRGFGLGAGRRSGAPSQNDPDELLAYMTRADAAAYERDYAQFERDMLDRASNDTSLIDDARVDSEMASQLAQGVASRNRQRYGANLTPAQLQQQQASFQRDSTLGGIQSLQDARLAQRDLNQDMLGKIIDVGQGVYQRSMQGMTAAASNKKALDNAYAAAKAQSKANTYSTIGTLGSAAIMAVAFL